MAFINKIDSKLVLSQVSMFSGSELLGTKSRKKFTKNSLSVGIQPMPHFITYTIIVYGGEIDAFGKISAFQPKDSGFYS